MDSSRGSATRLFGNVPSPGRIAFGASWMSASASGAGNSGCAMICCSGSSRSGDWHVDADRAAGCPDTSNGAARPTPRCPAARDESGRAVDFIAGVISCWATTPPLHARHPTPPALSTVVEEGAAPPHVPGRRSNAAESLWMPVRVASSPAGREPSRTGPLASSTARCAADSAVASVTLFGASNEPPVNRGLPRGHVSGG